jgi:hypothetical protein
MPGPTNLPEAVEAFRDLPVGTREGIVAAFESAPASISFDDLANLVIAKVKAPKPIVLELARGLGGLVGYIATDPSLQAMFKRLLASYPEGAKPTKEERQAFESQVERLMACEQSIGLTGKAQDILWGHGKVFKEAHTITQVRPIFYNDLKKPLTTAVIVHELRLDYREAGSDGTVCVTLDRSQVESLRRVLHRALDKEKGVRASAAFAYLAPLAETVQ